MSYLSYMSYLSSLTKLKLSHLDVNQGEALVGWAGDGLAGPINVDLCGQVHDPAEIIRVVIFKIS